MWALLALIRWGSSASSITIPAGCIIYSVLGLVIFGGFSIFDFNRLRRQQQGGAAAVPIAAGIFLDIFNVFLFMLQIFGGGGRR